MLAQAPDGPAEAVLDVPRARTRRCDPAREIVGAWTMSSWSYVAVAGMELALATMLVHAPSRSCVWCIASAALFAAGFFVTVAYGYSCRCFGLMGSVPRGWHAASAALLVTLSLIVFEAHRPKECKRV